MKTILFIDGENFKKKLVAIFKNAKQEVPEWHQYNFKGLFDKALSGIEIDKSIFYSAKLLEYEETREKSRELIEKQRLLKLQLEKQGFEFNISGRVRLQQKQGGVLGVVNKPIFVEKGVDVKIAVDMVTASCDKILKTAIIASSDSDLQPAISELSKRGTECIYLGFEQMLNKGLVYTTDRLILIRNSEVLSHKGTLL